MTLAVGPGTPAHVLWAQRYGDAEFERERIEAHELLFHRRGMMREDDSMIVSYASDKEGSESDREEVGDGEEESIGSDCLQDDDNEVEIVGSPLPGASPSISATPLRRQQQLELPTTVDWLPSMRHDSCVNTASWLNCPWRLSRADGGMSFSSGDQVVLPKGIASTYEMPTQVMTSGDDCVIKVWDLSNAMGSASPLPGGWDTFSPFAMTNIKELGSKEQKENWTKYYEERNSTCKVAGSVSLLASVPSNHQGNVVHLSPIADAPGKVLSCGFDGFLRLSDLESASSTVVIDPHIHDDFERSFTEIAGGGFGVNAFSHLLLTGNTGLLCCQRGLFRFDVRLSPNKQARKSLLNPVTPGASRSLGCKACAVWSPSSYRSHDSYPAYMNSQSEPSYIFVGGDMGFVELLDLRMLRGSSSQEKSILQRYSPTAFGGFPSVPVSGIDVSRDGRELLVSYESDQIYTYPICSSLPHCSAGPSKEGLDSFSKIFREQKNGSVPQLASYGGHVNHGAFLRNATYAGPNDEYILTGSDSSMAFIFDRSTTCVAALLSADSSTCNGIVAHPTLPFFVTYGIDASAKLWRACASQDSPAARAKASIEMPEYELSAVTFNGVESKPACIVSLNVKCPSFCLT
jgi:WD40 repeat protein